MRSCPLTVAAADNYYINATGNANQVRSVHLQPVRSVHLQPAEDLYSGMYDRVTSAADKFINGNTSFLKEENISVL